MSQENVELQRRLLEMFNTRDLAAFIESVDPGVEYHSAITVPGGTAYQGRDGIRKYFEDFEEAWGGEYRVDPEAFFDLGEDTLMFYVVRGRGQQSGAQVAMPGAQVARWSDGLLVYAKAYAQREDALKELGLSEAELKPIEP